MKPELIPCLSYPQRNRDSIQKLRQKLCCRYFQTNGFFVECGAFDGEYLSNTLYMERSLNWTGLLIEADQNAFHKLSSRNRKAYTAPACLSTKPYPIQVRDKLSYQIS
jgi:hypothetical protein